MVEMDSQERASRAVRAFSRMAPGLTSYVRSITGKRDIIVRAAPVTCTDGRYVNIRPPLVLADQTDHERRVCDERGEDSVLLCPACHRIEQVWACLYHETSHIVSGSLEKRPIADLVDYVLRGAARNPDTERVMRPYLEHYRDTSATAGVTHASIYEVANAGHPYLVSVLRATDDYVIEQAAIAARPGVEKMLYFMTEQIMTKGIENEDGTFTQWANQPVDSQIVIALLVDLHGWGLDGKFSDETIEVIRSDGIQELMQLEIPDVESALAAAAAYLAEFNRMGYLVFDPEDQDDEDGGNSEEGGQEGNSSSDPNGQSGGGGAGSGMSQEAERDADPSSSDASDGSYSGTAGNGAVGNQPKPNDPGDSGNSSPNGDPSNGANSSSPSSQYRKATPQEIERAMGQATGHEMNESLMEDGYAKGNAYGEASEFDPLGIDSPVDSDSGSGVDDNSGSYDQVDIDLVNREEMDLAISQALQFDEISREVGRVVVYGDDGPAFGAQGRPVVVDEADVAGSLMRARRVFSDNAMDKHVNNLKKGKVSARNLGARGWSDDRRVFRKKIRADKTDYEVVIGADISGSTSGGALGRIRAAVYAMSELLSRTNIDFSVYAHTTSTWTEVMEQEMYRIKDLRDPWNAESKERLGRLMPRAGSFDGHNFEFYRKVLDRSERIKRLCVYYTDGAIPETNHYEEAAIMTRESDMFRRLGYEALIVSVGRPLQDTYGFDQVTLERDTDLVKVLEALERKLTQK